MLKIIFPMKLSCIVWYLSQILFTLMSIDTHGFHISHDIVYFLCLDFLLIPKILTSLPLPLGFTYFWKNFKLGSHFWIFHIYTSRWNHIIEKNYIFCVSGFLASDIVLTFGHVVVILYSGFMILQVMERVGELINMNISDVYCDLFDC